MLRRFAIVVALAWASTALADPDLRMPPGTRKDPNGELISGRGLRDTTDFIAKELARRGIAATQIGPSRFRGIELTRFVSRTPATPYLAIHIMRLAGKTVIFFVPRSPLDETTPRR